MTAFSAINENSAPANPEHLTARKQNTAAIVTVASMVLLALLAWVDYRFTPKFHFSLLYLLIVAFAAWSGGKRAGIYVALICAIPLVLHEASLAGRQTLTWAGFWNVILQTGVFLVASSLVSGVRQRTEFLSRGVKERAAALENEIGDRRQTEEQLRKTMQQFRQLAENITDAFWMRDAGETRFGYISPAYEKIWGRTCRELYQSPQLWLEAIHPEDRERISQAMFAKEVTEENSQEYRIVRPDGSLRWIRDRAFPIRDGAGKVIRIVGIAEDITERHRLEREILEISDREQARLGQDLHDSLCQKLVSVAFDNNSLEQKLVARSVPEAAAVQQMADVLDDLITEARSLARGLFPVQLETDGLSVALGQLAANLSARAKLNCRLDSPQPVSISDNAVATHLYRIAQEAANNAVKHAQASEIVIRLRAHGELLELQVSDNGVGIPPATASSGMGMHIMNYRARTIGGSLTIKRGDHGGTVVSCVLRHQI